MAYALFCAIQSGDVERVKLCLQFCSNINHISLEDWNRPKTPLIMAAMRGELEITKMLLEKGCLIELADKDNYTAFMWATVKQHLEVTELLIEHGCNKEVIDRNNYTSLMKAAEHGHTEVTKLLLKYKTRTEDVDADNDTALMFAAGNGNLEVTKLLLDNNCNKEAVNIYGYTAFVIAAENGHLQVCRLLIDSGCNKDAIEMCGNTALHMAAESGHLEVTKMLVEYGRINSLIKNNEGKTAYDLAATKQYRQYKEVMKYLQTVMEKKLQDANTTPSEEIVEVPLTSKKLHVLSTKETKFEKSLSEFERKIYQSFRDKNYEVCKFLLENDVNEDVYQVLSTVLTKAFETKDSIIQDLVFSCIVHESPKIVKQFSMLYADIVGDAKVWMAVECTCDKAIQIQHESVDAKVWMAVECTCDKAIQIQHESVPCRKADLIFVIEKLVTKDYKFPTQYLGFQTLFFDSHASNEAAAVAEEMMKYQEKVPMKVPGTLAKKMFKQHSNLTMVCSSVFKSKGFMTGSNELQDLNCVQLFCKKKGIIPIGECHFPPLVDGIPTDVLEGTSKFLSAVNVGDKISCNEKHTGTLGGFVKYYGVDTFLTCSHVIFGKTDFLDLQSKDLHFESRHISIHNELEPVECVLIRHSLKYDTSEKPMDIAGETNTFSVLQDNPEETSIDAALILIQTPKNSNSSVLRNVLTRKITGASAASSDSNTPIVEQIIQLQGVDPIYLNKNVLDPEHAAGPAFALAGFSKMQESNVTLKREEEVIIPITAHVNMRDNIILYNQFILQNMSFKEGDSGTCIYGRCKKSGQTGCIGMLIGASTSGQYIVTPMKDILNALGVANMH